MKCTKLAKLIFYEVEKAHKNQIVTAVTDWTKSHFAEAAFSEDFDEVEVRERDSVASLLQRSALVERLAHVAALFRLKPS